jgi:hypothetical protein
LADQDGGTPPQRPELLAKAHGLEEQVEERRAAPPAAPRNGLGQDLVTLHAAPRCTSVVRRRRRLDERDQRVASDRLDPSAIARDPLDEGGPRPSQLPGGRDGLEVVAPTRVEAEQLHPGGGGDKLQRACPRTEAAELPVQHGAEVIAEIATSPLPRVDLRHALPAPISVHPVMERPREVEDSPHYP